MTAKDSSGLGLDRLNALFTWWGVPNSNGNGNVETQMKRFQAFASDLQKTYGEAYSHQMEALFTANSQLARSLQALVHCRQPQDVIAAESNILATLLEGASRQARTWVELTQRVQDCCAVMARETADGIGKPAKDERGAAPAVRPARSPAKEASAAHAAHA